MIFLTHYIAKKLKPAFLALIGLTLFAQCAKKPIESANIDRIDLPLNQTAERKFTALFFDANKAKILGNYQEAKALFNQALAVNPQNNAAKFELAKILTEEGNYAVATDLMAKVVEKDSKNIWYSQFLAQLYAETGKMEESISVVRKIIETHPERYEFYFTLGGLLSAQGRFDEALALYDKLESEIGVNEELSMQRQLIYMEKGDQEAALAEVDKLLATNPSEIRYYGMKAEILQEMGREGDALKIYEDMLEIEPNNGLVLLSLYEIAQKKGDTQNSEKYLLRAFESDELSIDVKVNVLLNMLSSREYKNNKDLLIALGEALEKAHGSEAKSFAIQGDILYNFEMLEAARAKFRKAVTLDPNRPPIWQQILTINSQLNDFEALIQESEMAMELFPQQPIFYLFNGVGLLQAKRPEEAIDALTTGKNLVIDNTAALAQFYASLGDAYHTIEDHQNSDQAYEMALKFEPSNALVLNNYAYYLALRNVNLDRAEAMAKKANEISPDQASFQDTYGWVLYMRGNYQNARFWIEQALNNGAENDPTVLDHFGDVMLQLKRQSEAIKYWNKAIEAGGDVTEIQQKIDKTKLDD
jgi:tetratricopeptide (TPR) repeat protein